MVATAAVSVLLTARAEAEPWVRRREGRFVILADRNIEAGYLDKLAGILRRAEQQLESELGFRFELPVMIRVHGSTAAYIDATGRVWWHGACTCGGMIHMQPPHILDERGILGWVVTHEAAHMALRSLAGGRLPLWLEEGLAELFALESVSAIDVEPDPESLARHEFGSAQELEYALVQTRDKDLAEAAYRFAAKQAARLRTRFGAEGLQACFELLADGAAPDRAFLEGFELTVKEFWARAPQWPLTLDPAPVIRLLPGDG